MVNEAPYIIKEYCSDIAIQMGIQLTGITVEENWTAFCPDAYLLKLRSDSQLISLVVYRPELDNLLVGSCNEKLEIMIRSALSHLQLMLEP
jgi:hypothetical protein